MPTSHYTLALAVYYVDSEGTCISGKCFAVGSGSSLAYSVLDAEDLESLTFTEASRSGSSLAYSVLDAEDLESLTFTEASRLAEKAIRLAAHRDGYSGGFINVLYVNATGIHHISRIDARYMSITTSVSSSQR